uniref:Ig-like domain-containing protein n=1 Tax=Chrysemys picta bellii TaxID=8478 RepID=A0A8C3FDQ4_CHRPI
ARRAGLAAGMTGGLSALGMTVSLIPAAPRLSIPQRSAGTDTETSFPCHVWGFYPGDVTVTWLRDGRVLTDATRSAPQRNPDGTFNLTLTYTFTPTASDSGSIFSCRVSHAALAQPLREEFPLAVTGEGVLGSQLDVMGCRGHSVESDMGPQQRPMLVH